MTTTNYTKALSRFVGRYCGLFLVAITGTFVLCTVSCRSTRETSRASEYQERLRFSTDSSAREIRMRTTTGVRADTARTVVSLTSLRNLPPSASYTADRGRAKVRLEVRDSLVYVTATCDSLALQMEYYESLAASYARKLDEVRAQQTEQLRRSSPINPLKPFFLGVALGAASFLFFQLKVKKS